MRLIRIVICMALCKEWNNGRYYEGGVSSVYMWDLDDGIAGVVLFKKSIPYFETLMIIGTPGAGWDSVHVFEALDHTRTASYKLTSTVMLHLTTSSSTLGSMNLSGNLTRQVNPPLNLAYRRWSKTILLNLPRHIFQI